MRNAIRITAIFLAMYALLGVWEIGLSLQAQRLASTSSFEAPDAR